MPKNSSEPENPRDLLAAGAREIASRLPGGATVLGGVTDFLAGLSGRQSPRRDQGGERPAGSIAGEQEQQTEEEQTERKATADRSGSAKRAVGIEPDGEVVDDEVDQGAVGAEGRDWRKTGLWIAVGLALFIGAIALGAIIGISMALNPARTSPAPSASPARPPVTLSLVA